MGRETLGHNWCELKAVKIHFEEGDDMGKHSPVDMGFENKPSSAPVDETILL